MRISHIFSFAGSLALLLTPVAKANLVANPSFESPTAGITLRYSTPGTPAGFSWTVGGAGVDLVGSYWTAQDRSQFLDLNQDIGHPTPTLTLPESKCRASTTHQPTFTL